MRKLFARFALPVMLLGAVWGTTSHDGFAADEQVRLGITPVDYQGSYFDITMIPGEVRELKVEIANHGASQISARTYAADAYTIINGGFGARLDGEPATGTTSWLSYLAKTEDIAPGTGLIRSFTVTVPADALPGEYITSLAVQNAVPTSTGGTGVVMNQVQRKVIAVAITVPGERTPSVTIGAVGHSYLATKSIVSASVVNTGNVRLKPAGELVVKEEGGAEVIRTNLTMDSFYAGDTTDLEAPFDKALLPGDYLVSLALDYDGGTVKVTDMPLNVPEPTKAEAAGAPTGAGQGATINQQARESSSDGPPMLLIGAVLTVLVAGTAGAWSWRRRRPMDSGRMG